MHPARTAELLHPFLVGANGQRLTTNDALHESISTYINLLQRWNSRINLTAIRDEEEIVTRHFGESLFAANYLFPKISSASSAPARSEAEGSSAVKEFDLESAEARRPKPEARLADLGSGAGFPGIPIKLWAPNIALTLIESNHKKATFLREVARALTLMEINIKNARAQTLAPGSFDVVTLRAVERLPEVLPVAASLLAPQGRLALLISSSQLDLTRSSLPRVSWETPIPIPESKSRQLLVGIMEPTTSTVE